MEESSIISFILFVIPPSEIKALEDAAKQYQPLLPFFAVFDKKVNLHFLLLNCAWNVA